MLITLITLITSQGMRTSVPFQTSKVCLGGVPGGFLKNLHLASGKAGTGFLDI